MTDYTQLAADMTEAGWTVLENPDSILAYRWDLNTAFRDPARFGLNVFVSEPSGFRINAPQPLGASLDPTAIAGLRVFLDAAERAGKE